MTEEVDHPVHYGGADDPYEAIKVIEDRGMGYGFCLGSSLKYLCRAGKKGSRKTDLKKALWYLDRCIEKRHAPHGDPGARRFELSLNDITDAWGLTGKLLLAVQLIAIGNLTGAARHLRAYIEGEAGDDDEGDAR